MLCTASFTADRRQRTRRRISVLFMEAFDLVTGGCGNPGKALNWCPVTNYTNGCKDPRLVLDPGTCKRHHERGPGTPCWPRGSSKAPRKEATLFPMTRGIPAPSGGRWREKHQPCPDYRAFPTLASDARTGASVSPEGIRPSSRRGDASDPVLVPSTAERPRPTHFRSP